MAKIPKIQPEQYPGYITDALRRMRRLLQTYENAAVELSWKGAQPPEYAAELQADYAAAVLRVQSAMAEELTKAFKLGRGAPANPDTPASVADKYLPPRKDAGNE